MNYYDIIKKPIVSEKSMDLIENGKYTFEVDKHATKTEIRAAVETVFGVKVKTVRTMNMAGKLKRQGAHQGRRPNWKKAIVQLTEDSKSIEFFDGME
ncbi:large subunit ribosomal protein L23 [Peptoniphilus asaccharolyticus DSM 20463]|uniref:Large ribosomal subunit protein uL23 n=1 Tax=Peptoniphilus asaccharolyticus DSM 20463 TaxID=573058 RepID=A0A1W1VKQ4_PEPAS|nr:50S ribosomal protein L23 [Peptoniphilus asaccharolyticus]MBL7574480.1 50S ribosomal protein L23 [Peptoniphilus asaccharolyticus]SMB93949.1 large subunit ribosomal protein L23 [Peptoniphilus asaccharolyticus DSM 20463]